MSCVEVILAKKEETLREFSKLKAVFDREALVSAASGFGFEERGEGRSFGSWENKCGVKIGVEEHAEDTCPHLGTKQLFDSYLLLV